MRRYSYIEFFITAKAVTTSRLLRAGAIAHLNEAEQKVRTAGFNPVGQILQGDPEKVIASYVEDKDISLLVMGAYGHSRIRQLVIGSTTAQMLRSSHIPVLLFR